MSDVATEPGTNEAETTAATTETTSQLPTGENVAQDQPPEEAQQTAEGQAPETDSQDETEVVAVEGGRGKWDKKLAKANEDAAELRKQNAILIEALAATKANPATQPAKEAAPTEDDPETILAKADQAAARYKESLDPTDAAEYQELSAKAQRAILKHNRELQQSLKAREQRETVTTEDQRRRMALEADWKQAGLTVAEGDALINQAFQRADARGLKGDQRHAAAEMAYDLLLGNLKQSKKSPTPATQKTTTASTTSVKTPAGTKLTPANTGVKPDPQRSQAAKLLAATLGTQRQ